MTSIIIGWCHGGNVFSHVCRPYTGCRPFRVPSPWHGSYQEFLHVDAAGAEDSSGETGGSGGLAVTLDGGTVDSGSAAVILDI